MNQKKFWLNFNNGIIPKRDDKFTLPITYENIIEFVDEKQLINEKYKCVYMNTFLNIEASYLHLLNNNITSFSYIIELHHFYDAYRESYSIIALFTTS